MLERSQKQQPANTISLLPPDLLGHWRLFHINTQDSSELWDHLGLRLYDTNALRRQGSDVGPTNLDDARPTSLADDAGVAAGRTSLFALVLPLFPGNGFGANLIRTYGTDIATGRLAADFAKLLVLFGLQCDWGLDLTLWIADIFTALVRADCEMRGHLRGNTHDLHRAARMACNSLGNAPE